MESELAGELFRLVRNVLAHFPFFDDWDEICINERIVNWESEGKFINKFLMTYQEAPKAKYRFWKKKRKRTNCISVKFPATYSNGANVY